MIGSAYELAGLLKVIHFVTPSDVQQDIYRAWTTPEDKGAVLRVVKIIDNLNNIAHAQPKGENQEAHQTSKADTPEGIAF